MSHQNVEYCGLQMCICPSDQLTGQYRLQARLTQAIQAQITFSVVLCIAS